ncbi:MAG TPA: vanadium-dependent haloperoxidase [Sphingobacteriaceae bacterium]
MKRFLLPVAAVLLMISSCTTKNYTRVVHDPALYRESVKKLNDIILENNFPPMIASRNYAYANIAAFEVIAAGDQENYNSLAGQIRHLTGAPKPPQDEPVDYHFAALLAFCTVGNAVTFPEGSMNEYVSNLKATAKDAGMPAAVFKSTVAYADAVAKHVLMWSKGDNYAQTRSASKHVIKDEDGLWIPTPTMYAPALEPHWSTIRPLVLDSASQIIAALPPAFDIKDIKSPFYTGVLEVKNTGDNLTDEQKHIADFWDDNPFKMNVVGHVSFATKKFSPGGHWMNIVGIASQKSNADFNSTVAAYTQTAIALFDGFISCWYMKYHTNYVRPETVINKHFDPEWRPYIQTPPFPEYTSGHGVISAAVAETLTQTFGDDFAFTDTSLREFGIADRSFKSFREAAVEAGMSRVYGGIHYGFTAKESYTQGMLVGQLVATRLDFRKPQPIKASR